MSDDRNSKVDHDTPPFSRLFVICPKDLDEEDIRAAFEEWGTLQDVWLVRNRTTQEKKGICYIKYEKASEAHIAMEKLHGEKIGSNSKPLKVLLADSKGQNRSIAGDAKPRSRIFILISKSTSSKEVEETFAEYGTIDHVQIITDRSTGESKGCAYVAYVKPSSAFVALENCPSSYKAVIAEPRIPRENRNMGGPNNSMGGGGVGGMVGYDARDNMGPRHMEEPRNSYNAPFMMNQEQPITHESISFTDMTDSDAVQRLYIVCHTSLFEEQLYSLFDLIPGLQSLELKYFRGSSESRGFAYAYYQTPELACYAKRKLNGMEYPPGHKLIVKYAESRINAKDRESSGSMDAGSSWNSASAISTYNTQANSSSCQYTDVSLPLQLPLAGSDTAVRGKLFIVGTPTLPPEDALVDVFCRFASLISVKPAPGTSYGYINYGSKESAEAATIVMNNKKICGNTVRLSTKDTEGGNENKRSRTSYEGSSSARQFH